MTLQKFKALARREKKTAVLRNGSFLCEKNRGIYRKMLYQVNGFYVEIYFVWFSKEAFYFSSFESTRRLQPYLQAIDISPLLQDLYINS